MACDACMWCSQQYGGWTNPVRLLILVQLAFVLLASSPAIAQPDTSYYDYDVTSRRQSLEDDESMVSHVFHTNELDGAVFSRARRNVDGEPKKTKENSGADSITATPQSKNTINGDTSIKTEMYQYYNSTYFSDENIAKMYWVDMDNNPHRQVNDSLNEGDYSKIVDLKFELPIYGYKARQINISTTGRLSATEHKNKWFSARQYVAPLRVYLVNFDTRLSNESWVKYVDNGTAFTVEWGEFVFRDRPEAGSFTFQATLHDNGDIVFVYSKFPLSVEALETLGVSFRIGLTDGYITEKKFSFVHRNTFNTYDDIDLKDRTIGNWTAIYLRALPNCLQMLNCHDCLTKAPQMDCRWCPKAQKCSNGPFRYLLEMGCERKNIKEENSCPAIQISNTENLDTVDDNVHPDFELSSNVDQNGAVLSRRRRYTGKEPEEAVHDDPIPEHPLINTKTNSSVNVPYSTDKLTPTGSSAGKPVEQHQLLSTDATQAPVIVDKPEPPKPTKNTTVVVSSPMNPADGQPIHAWANQTRWENATRTADEGKENATKTDAKLPAVQTDDAKPHAKEEAAKPDASKPEAKVNNGTIGKNSTQQSTNATDSDLGDISISKFSDVTNNTLVLNNITKTQEDTHQYYNSTFFSDENIAKMYWVDMDNHPNRQVNDLLSQSHRRAATVKLKFDFPFYGHKVRNITIATGGFLYTGEYVHSWLAATQYIAPLMANFDTRLSNASWVKYADNGTAFTVEWEEVVLQDKPGAGGFTFQATLYDNGNIVFVYSKIPLTVEAIEDTMHPVKVGLSDAYIMDRTIFFVRRKTIYEYHRVNFNRQEIRNWTVIYLRALPTCLGMDNCNDCLTKVPEFECKWCPDLNQCSTGTFRFRQDWLEKGCEQRNIKEQKSCPAIQRPYTENADNHDNPGHVHSDAGLSASVDQNNVVKGAAAGASILEHPDHMNMGVSGIIGILLVVSLVAGLAAWGGYAYRNPHSASGQMLIRYRPSQWSWRRGEARYTAATIHM